MRPLLKYIVRRQEIRKEVFSANAKSLFCLVDELDTGPDHLCIYDQLYRLSIMAFWSIIFFFHPFFDFFSRLKCLRRLKFLFSGFLFFICHLSLFPEPFLPFALNWHLGMCLVPRHTFGHVGVQFGTRTRIQARRWAIKGTRRPGTFLGTWAGILAHAWARGRAFWHPGAHLGTWAGILAPGHTFGAPTKYSPHLPYLPHLPPLRNFFRRGEYLGAPKYSPPKKIFFFWKNDLPP